MGWVEDISKAVSYIEENMTGELAIDKIAEQTLLSPFYFQKGFAILCGFTVGEYIRRRRLTLAGSELVSTNTKIIDIALKYGYDSPDSFTKAFTRFHGVTPNCCKKRRGDDQTVCPAENQIFIGRRLYYGLQNC